MTHTPQNIFVLPLADPQAVLENVGGKGASLARLANAGLPVPGGFHVTTHAYHLFVAENELQSRILETLQDADPARPETLETVSKRIHELFLQARIPPEIAGAVAQAYAALPGGLPTVAVRSSATAEDLPELSFAGQQATFLNVHDTAPLLEAVQRCWASLWTARAIGYRMLHNIDQNAVSLAVVVQMLVPADAAGIAFTANPVNGQRDQVVINASWGLGEAVVSGQVTPDALVIDKADGKVASRETAEKLVMTIRVDGGTQEQPVLEALRKAPVLSDAQASELARLCQQIEQVYQQPMDIEWALQDGRFSILQARPITAMPEAPLDWTPPSPKGVYMRGSVVDILPDPLSPLFATLGIPTLLKQMTPMASRMTHAKAVLHEDYFTTINQYAYMNSTMPPVTWWWVITGMLPAYPKLLRKLVQIWRDELHPEYQAFVASLQDKNPAEMSPAELWDTAQQILDAAMYYVCGLMFATMGANAGSEILLTSLYNKLAKQENDPPATAMLMGWNSIPIRAEKSLYDLAMWVKEHQSLCTYLLETPSDQIAAQFNAAETPANVSADDWQELRQRFEQHSQQFGYIIFQLDFVEPLPEDHPHLFIETIKMYLRGEGANPHERQQASQQKRIQTTETMLGRLKGIKLWAFRKSLNWAQSLSEVREDALAEIGLAYPRLRATLIELGKRFVSAGVIEQPDDIFWLEKDDVEVIIADRPRNLGSRVSENKASWQHLKAQTPPPMIPMKERVMGVKMEGLFVAQSADAHNGDILKGIAASPGVVTAPACVIHGPDDFNLMRPGAVLVAGTTTPAWTPLFAMASAIITDIGGPLSHGSIVAREYGIPAVMGTGVATRRIQNGQIITVDGNAGTIELSGALDRQ